MLGHQPKWFNLYTNWKGYKNSRWFNVSEIRIFTHYGNNCSHICCLVCLAPPYSGRSLNGKAMTAALVWLSAWVPCFLVVWVPLTIENIARREFWLISCFLTNFDYKIQTRLFFLNAALRHNKEILKMWEFLKICFEKSLLTHLWL